MRINEKQIQAVLALDGPQRYAHFLKVAADQRKAWGLYQDGWALAGSAEGDPLFPLWPAKEYAKVCAKNNWDAYEPREIDLDDLFEGLLPDLQEKGTGIVIFMTPQDRGLTPDLNQFEEDLRAELSRLE